MANRDSQEDDLSAGITVGIACSDLDVAVDEYRDLGLLLTAIGPADDPTWAEMRQPGLRLLLVLDEVLSKPLDKTLHETLQETLQETLDETLSEPGHRPFRAEFPPEFSDPALGDGAEVPDPVGTVEIQHESAENWIAGRAGMLYRDLIPSRYGGAYIASHIHIPVGGPVPDYVHHHDIAQQLIYCHRGWVEVVYQDQGPPFVMEPGDCVLQPPGLRHRVLAASDDLYVTEISSPAEHVTLVDNELELPTAGDPAPLRSYGGQRFVRHVGSQEPWQRVAPNVEQQLTAIEDATNGRAALRMLRLSPPVPAQSPQPQSSSISLNHDADLLFLFVVSGRAGVRVVQAAGAAQADRAVQAAGAARDDIHRDGQHQADSDASVAPVYLREGSSIAVPAGSNLMLDFDPGKPDPEPEPGPDSSPDAEHDSGPDVEQNTDRDPDHGPHQQTVLLELRSRRPKPTAP